MVSLKLGPLDESPIEADEDDDNDADGNDTDGNDTDGNDGINDDINNAPEVCKSICFVDESFMSTMPQMSGVSSSGLGMFFGWVRSFVACFLGKQNLEVFMARLTSNGIHE